VRALLRKELRELRSWFLSAALFVWIAVETGSGALSEASMPLLGLLAQALGVLLGYGQIRSEARRGTLSALVHRDTGLCRAIVAKGVAGACVLGLATALPFAVIWLVETARWEALPTVRWRGIAGPFAISLGAYGVGAFAATLRERISTRGFLALGGLITLWWATSGATGATYETLGDAPVAFTVLNVLGGAALFALAGRRWTLAEDQERRPPALETLLCAGACGAFVLLPALMVVRFMRNMRQALGVDAASVVLAEDLGEPGELELVPMRTAGTGIIARFDPSRGVVRVFDLRRLRVAVRGNVVRNATLSWLQPAEGPFSKDARVIAPGRIEDPALGRTFELRATEGPFLFELPRDGREERGRALLDPRIRKSYVLPASVVDTDILRPRIELYDDARVSPLDPVSDAPILTATYRSYGPLLPGTLQVLATFHGPLLGLVSFERDLEPAVATRLLLLDPLHAGGRRPGLLLVELAVAAFFARRARRKLRRAGASTARVRGWTFAVVAFGPLLWTILHLIEPPQPRARTTPRARSPRVIETPATPGRVSVERAGA